MAARKKKKKKQKTSRFRLMPLTVTMLALLLVIKMNDVFIGSRELDRALSVTSAYAADAEKKAEEAKPEEKAEAKGEEAKEEGGHGGGEAKKQDEEEMTLGGGKMSVKDVEKLKAEEKDNKYTDVELDILQNLSKRRAELDAREEELVLKETVLAATEDRINDKVRDMKKLKEDVDKVLLLYNEKQESEIKGLVKIYEAMKPIDAAMIFNEMEMPILLEVIDKMSERKVAPVLAGMSPKRARDVTQELAAMRKVRAQTREAAAGMTAQ